MAVRWRSAGIAAILFALGWGLAGCPAPDPASGLGNTTPPGQFLDYNQFVCTVEPVLIRRCSFLACHGQETHALRIYSQGKLRLGDDTTRKARSGTPLSADEVALNFDSASGLIYGVAPADRQPDAVNVAKVPLLAKPLRARFGGGEHHGVGIFPAWPAQALEDDAEWQALVAWVGGARQPNPVSKDCADLFSRMKLTPRTP